MLNFYETIQNHDQKILEKEEQEKKNKVEKHLAQVRDNQQRLINQLVEAKGKFDNAIQPLKLWLISSDNTSNALANVIEEFISQSKLIVDAKKSHESINRIEELTHIAHWVNSALNNQPMQDDKTLKILSHEIKRSSSIDKRSGRIMNSIGFAIVAIALAVFLAPYLWHVGALLYVSMAYYPKCLLGMGVYMSAVATYCIAAAFALLSIHTGLFEKTASVGSEVKALTQFFKPKSSPSDENLEEINQVSQQDEQSMVLSSAKS